MSKLKDKMVRRIRAGGRGKVYVSKDFLDLGSKASPRLCPPEWARIATESAHQGG
jgi:hypothetical protein